MFTYNKNQSLRWVIQPHDSWKLLMVKSEYWY